MSTLVDRWMRFWFAPAEPLNLALCRILCFAAFFVLHFRYDASQWAAPPSPFWMPISFFESLSLAQPTVELMRPLQFVWKLSLLASCVGLLTRASTITAAVLGLYILGLPNNFGKVDHNNPLEFFVLAIFAASRCGDALSVDRLIARARHGHTGVSTDRGPSGEYTWPIRCVWLAYSLVFFAAGYAKLKNSGFAWVYSDNFANLMMREDDTSVLGWLARDLSRFGWACNVLAGASLLLEVSYPLALVSRRARLVVVPGVFAMQVGILLLMGIAFYPSLICCLFWIPWDRWVRVVNRAWERAKIWRDGRVEGMP